MFEVVLCPGCGKERYRLSGSCEYCGQEFCPDCDEAIGADEPMCVHCGASFEFCCPGCGEELGPEAEVCPNCGEEFGEPAGQDVAICPGCQAEIYLGDGFCRECGQPVCFNCGAAVGEDDRACGNCDARLSFICRVCQFELMAGTSICPSCNTFYPNYCTACAAPLDMESAECPNCHAPVEVSMREGARTVQNFTIAEAVIRLIACPQCGKTFDPAAAGPITACPCCAIRVCARCHFVLQPAEIYCPNCGRIEVATGSHQHLCPSCEQPVESGSGECDSCGQLLCPSCQAALSDEDVICPECGAEFELYCPECDNLISISDSRCPRCGLLF